jgi:hypothetical protein
LTAAIEGKVRDEVCAELGEHGERDAIEDGLFGAAVDLGVHFVKVVKVEVLAQKLLACAGGVIEWGGLGAYSGVSTMSG